jgi:hypothetical protein
MPDPVVLLLYRSWKMAIERSINSRRASVPVQLSMEGGKAWVV